MLVELAVASLLPLLSPSPVLILIFFSLSIVQEYILVYESVFTRGQTLRRRILADAWFMARLVEIFGLGSGGVCVCSILVALRIYLCCCCVHYFHSAAPPSFLSSSLWEKEGCLAGRFCGAGSFVSGGRRPRASAVHGGRMLDTTPAVERLQWQPG